METVSLAKAIKSGANLETIKELVEDGALIIEDEYVEYLASAVDLNNVELVQYLLNYIDSDSDSIREPSKTIVYRACEAENPSPKVVKAILDYGLYFNQNILTVTACEDSIYRCSTRTPGMRKIILKHVASLSTKCNTEIDWTKLSCAIFNEDFALVKQLIENGHEIDMLCAYTAVVCDNKDILEFLWDNIAPELFSNDLYFMIHVFDNWGYKDKIRKFWLLLNKEGVNLHLERCGKAFTYFIIHMSHRAFENVSDEEQLALLQCLEARGLRLMNERDVQLIAFSSSTKLFEFIISIFLPKIPRNVFYAAVLEGSDKCVLQYCMDADIDELLHSRIFDSNLEHMQYYLQRFSSTRGYEFSPLKTARFRPDASTTQCRITIPANFKSLLELSRNVIRKQLNEICKDSRQLLHILDTLNLPTYIRDIIQCKVPVNPLVSVAYDT